MKYFPSAPRLGLDQFSWIFAGVGGFGVPASDNSLSNCLPPLNCWKRSTTSCHLLTWSGQPDSSLEVLRCIFEEAPNCRNCICSQRICNLLHLVIFESSKFSFFCTFPHSLTFTIGCPLCTFSPQGTYINRQVSMGSKRDPHYWICLLFSFAYCICLYCFFILVAWKLKKTWGR